MDATIRPATLADRPALSDLYAQLHASDPPWPSEQAAANALSKVLAHPGTTIFVGTVENRVVSTCVLIVCPNFSRGGRPFAIIENVVTDHEHRKHGYGRQMVQHAIDSARQLGCYKVTLTTGRRDPETLRFYEGSGMRRDTRTAFEARFI